MLNRETNHCRRSQIIGSQHRNHHYQQTKLCLPSSLMTTGSKENKTIASFINNNTTIDAILFEEGNSQLVSKAPRSYPVATTELSSCLVSQASLTKRTIIKTTVPNYTGSPKISQITRSRFIQITNPNSTRQQQQQLIKMNFIYFLTALLLTLCAISHVTADGSLNSNLQKLKISPDIINIPSSVDVIKVELHGNTVKPGDPVPAKNFKDLNMAKIVWDVSNYDARHTLLLLDLDRKHAGNATNSIYNQFTSLNIPGNVINAGQTIVAFDTPIVPCQPSSKHRILMLAFHQKQNIDISDVAYMSASSGQSSKRENFKINDFINRHRLDLVAANVFLAIGETNGICSSSATLHSLQGVSSSILIAMVTAIIALRLTSYRRPIVN